MNNYNEMAAILFVRLFLGVLFLFQGYDKVFKVKMNGVIESFEIPAEAHRVPHWMLYFGALYTSYVEFFGGILLILGLFEYILLYALAADLIIVAVGFGIFRPMWNMQHVFPRLILILILLLLPAEANKISLDYLLGLI